MTLIGWIARVVGHALLKGIKLFFVIVMNFALVQSMMMINQDFGRLEQFDSRNFHKWQQKTHFLLTTLGLVHVLIEESPIRSANDSEDHTNNLNLWHCHDYICRNSVLNAIMTLFMMFVGQPGLQRSYRMLWCKNITRRMLVIINI